MAIDETNLCPSCRLLQSHPEFDVTHYLLEVGQSIQSGSERIQDFMCPGCGARWCQSRDSERSNRFHWTLR